MNVHGSICSNCGSFHWVWLLENSEYLFNSEFVIKMLIFFFHGWVQGFCSVARMNKVVISAFSLFLQKWTGNTTQRKRTPRKWQQLNWFWWKLFCHFLSISAENGAELAENRLERSGAVSGIQKNQVERERSGPEVVGTGTERYERAKSAAQNPPHHKITQSLKLILKVTTKLSVWIHY